MLATLTALLTLAPVPERLVMISWDGAPDWVIDRMLDEGKLPNVARLAATGVRAESLIPAYPSQTAATHAAIFTGAWGGTNGISGNQVPLLPKSEHTALERRSGFDSRGLLVEPIYIAAAKQGKKVVVLSATQAYPPAPHIENLKKAGVPLDRYVQWSGFESEIAPARMIDMSESKLSKPDPEMQLKVETVRALQFPIGDDEIIVHAWDDPNDPVKGFDTVTIKRRGSERSTSIKPAPAKDDLIAWSNPIRVAKGELVGNMAFRLFALSPDGRTMELYQRGVNGLVGTTDDTETRQYLANYGGFHSDPFGAYQAGAYGKTLADGGSGEAERRVLEMVRLDCQYLKNGTRYALERYRPDLLFHYTPMSDSAGHAWVGILDPDSPNHNPALAEKLWPFYEKVLQLQDEWLGDTIDAAGPNSAVALVSDHGMQGFGSVFYPNVILERAGLMKFDAQGNIDLASSKVFAAPWSLNALVVNTLDRKGGIVPVAQKASVLRQAQAALAEAKDWTNGTRVVERFFWPEDMVGFGLQGPTTGDLYLDLHSAYTFSTRNNGQATSKWNPLGSGQHGYWPLRRKMQAIFFLGGAGVRQGTLPSIRQIDVAPTLFELMGLTRLPHFEGLAAPVRGEKRADGM